MHPPWGLETRMSHYWDDHVFRLLAFDPYFFFFFFAWRQANLSICGKGKKVLFVSGRENKEDFYWEWCIWTARVEGILCCERNHIISQRGFHVASRGWGHFLLGSSCVVNIFREPGGDFSEGGFFSSLLTENRLWLDDTSHELLWRCQLEFIA